MGNNASTEWLEYGVLSAKGLNATHIGVLSTICSKADKNKHYLTNMKDLGLGCGLSEKHTARIVNFLAKTGLIKKVIDRAARKTSITVVIEDRKPPEAPEPVVNKPPKNKPAPKNTIVDLREDLFAKIQQAYHPERAYLQPATARTVFNRECENAARAFRTKDAKEKAILVLYQKIVDFIEHVKTTDTWTREDGKYLQGLGNLLASGKWKTHTIRKRVNNPDKDALKNIFGR